MTKKGFILKHLSQKSPLQSIWAILGDLWGVAENRRLQPRRCLGEYTRLSNQVWDSKISPKYFKRSQFMFLRFLEKCIVRGRNFEKMSKITSFTPFCSKVQKYIIMYSLARINASCKVLENFTIRLETLKCLQKLQMLPNWYVLIPKIIYWMLTYIVEALKRWQKVHILLHFSSKSQKIENKQKYGFCPRQRNLVDHARNSK